jgi:sugar phosphate isomerase/epimerase
MNRRDALRLAAGGGLAAMVRNSAASLAAESPAPAPLGLVIYCCGLRQNAERQKDPKRDLFEPLNFLEHCHRLGAGGVQVPLGIRDAQYVKRFRKQADDYGMFIEGIASPPRDPADLARFDAEMRTAAMIGAKCVRTVILPGRRYEFFDSAEQFRQYDQQARKSVELAAPVVERHRVRLAIENHKDHRIPERIDLLKQISSEWVGACVDVGNSLALLEDPMETVEAYAPWACSVHLKDHAVREYHEGFLLADVPLGQGFLDLKKMMNILRKAKPEIPFTLELITRDPLKVPCLTEKYWATFAATPGRDLARALRLVRQHQAKSLPTVSNLPLDEQVAAEDRNIQSSLQWASERLTAHLE